MWDEIIDLVIELIKARWDMIKQAPIEIWILIGIIEGVIFWIYYKPIINRKNDIINTSEDRINQFEKNQKEIILLETKKEESLKNRISLLATKISGFLIERESKPVTKTVNYNQETVVKYLQRFSPEMIKIKGELVEQGITDRILDKHYNNCTRIDQIEAVEYTLRELVKKLP